MYPTTIHHPPPTTYHCPAHHSALSTPPCPLLRAHQMMEKMSPEELVASSKMAQQQMAKMSPEEMESAAKVRMGRG